MYQVSISGQLCTIAKVGTSVVGSVGTETAVFDFDGSWSGLTVYAAFRNSSAGKEYLVLLDDSLECEVPWEMYTQQGELQIGALGLRDGEIVKPTIWAAASNVKVGVSVKGEATQEPTPTVFEQLTTLAQQAVDASNHPPYIGENYTWMVWDALTSQYVDSGMSSVGEAVPYVSVNELPALTDSVKNIVYKYDEQYYVARVPNEVSTIYSDNLYGIGITTPKTASEIKVVVDSLGNVYDVNNLALVRDVVRSETYYMSIYYREEPFDDGNGGYEYIDVGYLCIKYGEYAGSYDDPGAIRIGTVDDLLAGTLKIETGSEQIELLELTELGKAVFGDALKWVNFLTGEDDDSNPYVTEKDVVKLVKQYTDEAILGGAW